jgi:hypothetical protein
MVFTKPGVTRPVVIRGYDPVPVFIKNNLHSAGMSRERFLNFSIYSVPIAIAAALSLSKRHSCCPCACLCHDERSNHIQDEDARDLEKTIRGWSAVDDEIWYRLGKCMPS